MKFAIMSQLCKSSLLFAILFKKSLVKKSFLLVSLESRLKGIHLICKKRLQNGLKRSGKNGKFLKFHSLIFFFSSKRFFFFFQDIYVWLCMPKKFWNVFEKEAKFIWTKVRYSLFRAARLIFAPLISLKPGFFFTHSSFFFTRIRVKWIWVKLFFFTQTSLVSFKFEWNEFEWNFFFSLKPALFHSHSSEMNLSETFFSLKPVLFHLDPLHPQFVQMIIIRKFQCWWCYY